MKIPLFAFTLALPLSAAAQTPSAPVEPRAGPEFQPHMPNAFERERPGCLPIVQQIAGENREYSGSRLDQQPPARLLFAVDRQVDGCREVTFVHERRIGGRAEAGRPRR